MLATIAKHLDTTVDALLGLERPARTISANDSPEKRRLWQRFQILTALPEKDQRAILRMLDTMAVARLAPDETARPA